MPLIIAIEPDSRQASIVKRIVRERVGADVVLAESKDAALAALRQRVPDLILVSALLSPRDEAHLTDHLRELAEAEHLQTLTIPLLASGPQAAPLKKGKGLLAKLSRKRPVAGTEGCDPAVFAEEIRVYLDRAHEVRRESAARRERDRLEAIEAERLEAIEAEMEASMAAVAERALDTPETVDVDQELEVETEEAAEADALVFETTLEQESVLEAVPTEVEWNEDVVELSGALDRLSEDEQELFLAPKTPARPEVTSHAAARLEAERLEAAQREERLQAERLEATRREAERLEAERLEAAQREERLQAEQLEAMRREAARLEGERLEAAQREAERLQAEQVEAMRREAARRDAERLDLIRRDAERRDAERLEAMRREAERLEAAQREAGRLQAEQLEAMRREAARREAARLDVIRRDAERRDAERLEAMRREAERLEAQRLEAMRQDAERLEAERVEALRREAERLEAQRLETLRREAERLEVQRLEAARREAEQLEAARREAERLSKQPEEVSDTPATEPRVPDSLMRDRNWITSAIDALRMEVQLLRAGRAVSAPSAPDAPVEVSPVKGQHDADVSPASQKKPGKKKAQAGKAKPLQDEWGIYDPRQAGFDAVFAKIEEVSHEDESEDDQPYPIRDSDGIDASNMLVTHPSFSSFTAGRAATLTSPKRAGLAPFLTARGAPPPLALLLDSARRNSRGRFAMWAHAGTTDPWTLKTPASDDDLHRLMGQLQLPAAVASVSYPSGCRIRQIRVTPKAPSARKTKSKEPIVILSRKRLRELRRKEKPSAVSHQPSAIGHQPRSAEE